MSVKDHENLFEEAGIPYTRDPRLAKTLGFHKYKYTSDYKGNTFKRDVYCRNIEALYTLINHWNSVGMPDKWSFRIDTK